MEHHYLLGETKVVTNQPNLTTNVTLVFGFRVAMETRP